jgi:hypothetical protein
MASRRPLDSASATMENMPIKKNNTSKLTTAGTWSTERGPGTIATKAARDIIDQTGNLGNLGLASIPAMMIKTMTRE